MEDVLRLAHKMSVVVPPRRSNLAEGEIGLVAQEKWSTPPPDVLKINSDVAVSEEQGRVRLGVVARSSDGQVFFSVGKLVPSCLNVQVAEALAIQLRLQIEKIQVLISSSVSLILSSVLICYQMT